MKRFALICCLLPIAISTGCSSKNPTSTGGTAESPAPKMAFTGAPVTAEEAKQFAEKLEQSIRSGDKATADSLFRVDEMVERSISDLQPPAGFLAGVKSGMARSAGTITDQIMPTVKRGGSYKLLRIQKEGES